MNTERVGEPFRIGSKLSQSGKHKKPRRESRLFSFKSRVFWGFLLTAVPSCSSLPARSTSRIARFRVPTPLRIAKSLGLSRLTAADWLTELGSVESLLVALSREFEITRAPKVGVSSHVALQTRFVAMPPANFTKIALNFVLSIHLENSVTGTTVRGEILVKQGSPQ